MLARRGQAVATHARLRSGLTRISQLITGHEKPVLATVDGVCLGAGAGLALSCDGLIATARSTFGFPFVKVGLVPDTSTSWLLPRFVGMQQARRLLLTGELIPAEEAMRIGLVMKLVPDAAALERETAEWGKRFAALPETGVRDIKRLFWTNLSAPIGHAVAHEALVQAVRFTSDEHAKASEAFLARKS
jgi:2-(1,2-epoxy-1,2-dihydrophenyl)acetyl-CoA isomerase